MHSNRQAGMTVQYSTQVSASQWLALIQGKTFPITLERARNPMDPCLLNQCTSQAGLLQGKGLGIIVESWPCLLLPIISPQSHMPPPQASHAPKTHCISQAWPMQTWPQGLDLVWGRNPCAGLLYSLVQV